MKKIIFTFIILIVFTSCLGTKKITENNTSKKTTETSAIKKDSSNVIEKNGAINDKLKVAIPKVNTSDAVFNQKCTEIIDQLLEQVNTQKSSGNNNYSLYYNLEKRLLELQVQIAETKNETTATNNEVISEKSTEEKIDSYIYKKVSVIPWYVWLGVIVFFLPNIIDRILLIINPIKGLVQKLK